MSYKTITEVAVSNILDTSIYNPFDGSEVGHVPDMPPESTELLLEVARQGKKVSRRLPRHERARVLEKCAALIDRDAENFAMLIAMEAGKTLKQARKEVVRCINTLKLSADEAKRNNGEVVPFDAYRGSENRQGWFTREPLGIILAITPYNDPLNLVAHKLGPAIAGGNSIILKPSELAPLSAIKLVHYLHVAGLPPSVVSVATGGGALAEALVASREIRMISFTGGFVTGEKIARAAGLKKLAMDLGGNAPVIVMDDCDLQDAVESIVSGSFWAAGQNCVGVQRILVHDTIYDIFRERFVRQCMQLKAGDPLDAEVDVGPMISITAAQRVEQVVNDAIESGAELLCGHRREGSLYAPTVLENVSLNCKLWVEEVFAPVVALQRFHGIEEALELANSPEYSLHAAIFTASLTTALKASAELEAGGVMINDSSDYRFDAMPFGGFKYGSLGREGIRFAYEEMTQPKVVCIRNSNG